MCIKERNASDSTSKKLLRDKGCFPNSVIMLFFKEDRSFNLKNLFQEKMICRP